MKLQTVYYSGFEKHNKQPFHTNRRLINISTLSVAVVGSTTPTRTVACLSHTPSPTQTDVCRCGSTHTTQQRCDGARGIESAQNPSWSTLKLENTL